MLKFDLRKAINHGLKIKSNTINSISHLAKRMNVKDPVIERAMYAQSDMRLSTIHRYAEAFNVEMSTFLKWGWSIR